MVVDGMHAWHKSRGEKRAAYAMLYLCLHQWRHPRLRPYRCHFRRCCRTRFDLVASVSRFLCSHPAGASSAAAAVWPPWPTFGDVLARSARAYYVRGGREYVDSCMSCALLVRLHHGEEDPGEICVAYAVGLDHALAARSSSTVTECGIRSQSAS
jgi:hypothetical protein